MKSSVWTKFAVGFLSAFYPVAAQADAITAEDLQVEAEIPNNGTNMAFGHNALWVASGFSVLRIDPSDNSVQEVALKGASQKQRRLLIGPKSVWIADVGANTLFRIDPKTGETLLAFPAEMSSSSGSIAVGADSVWVVTAENFERMLSRFDAITGAVQAQIDLPEIGFGTAFAGGHVWVSSGRKDEIYRVDPDNDMLVQTIATGSSPRLMVDAAGSLWVHTIGDGAVQRIDSETGEIVATIDADLPLGAGEIVARENGVSLSTPYQLQFLSIDASTNSVVMRVTGRQGAEDHAAGAGSLWLGGSKIRRVVPPQ